MDSYYYLEDCDITNLDINPGVYVFKLTDNELQSSTAFKLVKL